MQWFLCNSLFKIKRLDSRFFLFQEVTENLTIQDIKGRKLPAVSVFSQMIFKLKERVIHEDMENKYHADNIQWVLSIPAVWSDRAEHFMRTCAGRVSADLNILMTKHVFYGVHNLGHTEIISQTS